MQSALESRILQLEAENAELSAAASEAAALAEEYAADAAAYRRSVSSAPADAALVNELTDAARRKDRRINRLNALLAAERENVQQLQQKLDELTELNALADEMEDTLRKSVVALQRRLEDGEKGGGEIGKGVSGGKGEGLRVQVTVADAVVQTLTRYFPENTHVAGDVTAFSALRSAVRTLQMASGLTERLQQGGFGPHEDDFLQLVESITATAETAVRWCFEDATQISARGPPVEKELRELEDRTRSLSGDLASADDVRAWSDDFARMKLDLVSMALDTLGALVPQCFDNQAGAYGIEGLIADVTRTADMRAREVAGSLAVCTETAESDPQHIAELEAKLGAAESKLESKTKELEDLRVRTSVFEERISATLGDAKEITALRQKISDLEAELTESKQALVANCSKKGSEGETKEQTRDVKREDAESSPSVPRYLDVIDDAKESVRLRRVLMHRHLADLQTLPLSTNADEQLTFEKNREVCETVRTALESAREAASNARAVRLDADTLQPNTRPATMSRKVLLQALALANQHALHDVNKRIMRDGTQSHELRFINTSEDVHSVASTLRQSLRL